MRQYRKAVKNQKMAWRIKRNNRNSQAAAISVA